MIDVHIKAAFPACSSRWICSPQESIRRGLASAVNGFFRKEKSALACALVGLSGLEPPTPTLSGWCSNLLSYNPISTINLAEPYLATVSVSHLPCVARWCSKPCELQSYINFWLFRRRSAQRLRFYLSDKPCPNNLSVYINGLRTLPEDFLYISRLAQKRKTVVARRHSALVEMSGIEPLTPCLQGRCSPSWATPPYFLLLSAKIFFGGPKWTWTTDLTLIRRAL